jgi:gamma-glutamyltranspeptidase/glutathione hydrolase
LENSLNQLPQRIIRNDSAILESSCFIDRFKGLTMLNTTIATRGMAVAPHSLAAQAALSVLNNGGGNAIEAMVAAAAAIAVVYPHMNSIGGDGFWVISEPDRPVVAVQGCGVAGAGVSRDLYREHKLGSIPTRGPLAANTLAGTVGGWQQALDISAQWGGKLPLSRLLEDAIHYAEQMVSPEVVYEDFAGIGV